jgi:hypothetical protein
MYFEDFPIIENTMLHCALGYSSKEVHIKDVIEMNANIGREVAGPIGR